MVQNSNGAAAPASFKRKALALALGGALLVAPVTGAAAAAVQPAQVAAQSVTSIGAGTQSSVQASLQLGGLATSQTSLAASAEIGAEAQKRISIRPVLDWIKRNAPAIWDSMKRAVKKGWSAFKSWWNSLASWIRWSIDFLASGGLWELFDALRHYFF